MATKEVEPSGRKPRVREPDRSQGEIRFEIPEEAIPPSHPARLLWNVLGTLDLSGFNKGCGAVEGKAGRSKLSPRMLLTLWLYGITHGVGSARELARLTRSDVAYGWIVGSLKVSHHTLSSFRVGHGEPLNELMTDVLASLMAKELVSLELGAQDGTRVRAAATAPSFRTYGSLLQCREQAALHLKAVLASAGDPEHSRAQRAAREAAARDFQRRIEEAIAAVGELQEHRSPSAGPARASTTDVDARVMKMPDGGFRPGFNVQSITVGSEMGGPRTIVAVRVTNVGSDLGSLAPMAKQVEERTGQVPAVLMADANHVKHDDIAATRRMGVDVLVPPLERGKSLEQLRQEGADPEVIKWRERMDTEDAQTTYRARAGLAELTNAHQKRHHGIDHVLVRGLKKVTCVMLINAIGSNLLQHAASLLA